MEKSVFHMNITFDVFYSLSSMKEQGVPGGVSGMYIFNFFLGGLIFSHPHTAAFPSRAASSQ
jgi:hypothetical protein